MKIDYEQSEFKCRARLENITLYRKITGLQKISSDKEYWTLCNVQSQEPSSEINQLISLGLISESQFVGVDFSEWIR